jgi:5-methyltetrahydropteroyltriglutamate--homocysteine methyltransferase
MPAAGSCNSLRSFLPIFDDGQREALRARGCDRVADLRFNQIGLNGYFMEYDSERTGLRAATSCSERQNGCAATGNVEDTRDGIERGTRGRIEEAARFADIDQMCLSPQCDVWG